MIISTNLTNLVEQIFYCCYRLRDRSYKKSARNTISLSQDDYEKVYMGSNSSMEYKYANMLTVLLVTMMYGGGIPILYLISALYFFVTYWTNKLLIF